MDPLDRPIWHSLNGGWRAFAVGDACALRLRAPVGVFGAARDAEAPSIAALGRLGEAAGGYWAIERRPMPVPRGHAAVREVAIEQMVLDRLADDGSGSDAGIVPLGPSQGAAMVALARLTEPGPFNAETWRLGGFVGRFEGTRLVAMAGERMRVPGLTEVSAVCTHPDHRGQGHARALMAAVIRGILARGEGAFLHSYASNSSAIALYGSLGFRRRATMTVSVVAPLSHFAGEHI